jgi:NAD(P)-dependent dehydrogenase (short-subunit alcohol dehydrogenase family)
MGQFGFVRHHSVEEQRMSGWLEGKAVAVTGAGRGIGRAVALLAAAEGARVVVADYGGAVDGRSKASSDVADAVVAEIKSAGGQAVARADDVSTMEGGRQIVKAAVDSFGRLDGMVCCAGIMPPNYIWEIEEKEWDDVIAVHVKGHFSCFQAAAKIMMEQRSGSLVSISSGAALTSPPNLLAYATAKSAILGLTWSTANALARHGIRANCVMPNAATRMSDNYYGQVEWLSDQVGETIRSDLAQGTYRDPAQMAPLVCYLLSDAARAISAQVFRAQGYEIQHLGVPVVWDKSMTNTGPWDIATIAERLPKELGPRLKPQAVPWPEKPQ